jgi:hypothetical protein
MAPVRVLVTVVGVDLIMAFPFFGAAPRRVNEA